jgi:DNA repair exonuclease SbcCD ATPase subunit
MRFTFLFSLIATIIFGVAYWYVNTAGVCPTPIYYQLGEVDDRFGISEAEAREVLAEAEAVWEKALGRELFEYNDETSFTVNFMYDERQKEASTEENWRISLDDKEAKTKTTFAAIEALQSEYETKRKEYETARERYESKLASYNNKVEEVNAKGGAKADEFKALEAEKTSLSSELKSLLVLETALNQAGEELNTKGEAANAEVEAYNAEVVRYNEVYGERSETFTQGDYERKRINVYTFSTKDELKTVLAHEFGHALGIGHVEGSQSLMYYLMADQPDKLSLSAEDLASLTTICGEGDSLTSTIRRAIRTALTYL